MRFEVVNIHAKSLWSGSEHLRTGHGLVRAGGAKHDDVRAKLQLRMADDQPRLRDRELFNEAEGRAERSNRAENDGFLHDE